MYLPIHRVIRCPQSGGGVIYAYVCEDCEHYNGIKEFPDNWYKEAIICDYGNKLDLIVELGGNSVAWAEFLKNMRTDDN